MVIPKYRTLVLPVLTVAADGELRVPMAAEKIVDWLDLSEDEREKSLPVSKQTMLRNPAIYMSHYGSLNMPPQSNLSAF